VNDESAREGAPVNSSGGRVQYNNHPISTLLAGKIQPHELPWELWLLWADGFHAGQNRAQVRTDRAERAADVYYDLWVNGDEARKRHAELLKHFDVVQARKAVSA
jgi:hypothetical protein